MRRTTALFLLTALFTGQLAALSCPMGIERVADVSASGHDVHAGAAEGALVHDAPATDAHAGHEGHEPTYGQSVPVDQDSRPGHAGHDTHGGHGDADGPTDCRILMSCGALAMAAPLVTPRLQLASAAWAAAPPLASLSANPPVVESPPPRRV
jgi:hypothetical protein